MCIAHLYMKNEDKSQEEINTTRGTFRSQTQDQGSESKKKHILYTQVVHPCNRNIDVHWSTRIEKLLRFHFRWGANKLVIITFTFIDLIHRAAGNKNTLA